jgi:outer membrane protein TolC
MRSRIVRLLLVLGALPSGLAAQDAGAAPRQLSLADAINLARQNSPAYRQAINDEDPAAAQVRAAYGQLLPNVSSSAGISYARAGRQTIANQIFSQGASTVSSNYNIGVSLGLSYGTFLAPKQAKAQQRVTQENIASAGLNLTADITNQYLLALRADASVLVAEQQVARNGDFRDQARARFQVGRGDMVEVRQSEVAKSNADVQLLRARQNAIETRIELLRRMGIPAGTSAGTARGNRAGRCRLDRGTRRTLRVFAIVLHQHRAIRLHAAIHQRGSADRRTGCRSAVVGNELRLPERDPGAAYVAASFAEWRHHPGLQRLRRARRQRDAPAPRSGTVDS